MRSVRLLIAAMVLSCAAPTLCAQQRSEWQALLDLQTRARIEVTTKAAPEQKIRGRIESVSADRVVILLKGSGSEREFAREQIARVRTRRSNIAPVIGAVVGGAVPIPFATEDGGSAARAAAFVAVWAGIGWLIGKAIQHGAWKTIYEV